MNKYQGIVNSIKTEGSLSLVEILVDKHIFTSVIIDDIKSSSSLKKGKEIQILFKETEVILANAQITGISLRNKIDGKIEKIEKGSILSKVVLTSSIGELNSIITTGSVENLNLKIGDTVSAMIKTNEIFLKYD
jgi:molybdopterin-binding protein